jgi:hypothetical protein
MKFPFAVKSFRTCPRTNFGFLAVLALAIGCPRSGAALLFIENNALTANYDDSTQTFTVARKSSENIFLKDGRLERAAMPCRTESARDPVFGKGRKIVIPVANGENSLELYDDLPFLLIRGTRHNSGSNVIEITKSVPATFTVNLDKPANELKTIGTGGLLAPDRNPGSYLFLTCADPETRRGVVAGWLTEDRGSGVFFSDVNDDKVNFRAQIDYGHLRIPGGKSAALETLAVGYFDDARIGEELYADALRKQYHIVLRPPSAVYCSWYSESHGKAGDEKSTVELAKFAAKELKPFGFGVVQIDDEWQDSQHFNGPRRGFGRVRPDGPYPHGIAPVAAAVEQEGLTFGLWWLPFARNYQDPEYKDRQDWFVKRDNGKPYDTEWGGTCLDLTHPDVRAHLARLARLYRSWGVKYYKMDGLWTGAACEQIYVNDGYKDDHFGNNQPLHDPLVSNIEAYRSGLKLLRKSAGDDVFFSGCCISQNMREMTAIGLVDSMRVGPDANGDIRVGPLRGSRLYFLNGRVWWNDPDPAVTRAAGSGMGVNSVTRDEARLTTSWVALTGQFFLLSDWLPDLPPERIDILKRTMAHRNAAARPVDYFDNPLPTTWLVTATNDTVRRDVIGIFNMETSPLKIEDTCAWLGLDPSKKYFAFDFWADAPLPAFAEKFDCVVPARSCRVIAVRSMEDHPVLVSTSRHVTQGIVDVRDEKWNAKKHTLSGVSEVVGNDPYELRVAGLDANGKKWKPVSVTVSNRDKDAGVAINSKPVVAGEEGWLRVGITSSQSRSVNWSVTFESAD